MNLGDKFMLGIAGIMVFIPLVALDILLVYGVLDVLGVIK